MGSHIKGITVEIGGDTTKLGKALADVNSKTKNLQSELRGVNSLLKMDPSNVTLLKQKQDLLNNSIENTKQKLEKLKQAQSQVQRQFDEGKITEEQYRDFQREIEATEKKLKSLEEQSKKFGSVFAQQLSVAGDKLKDIGGKIEDVGKKVSVVSGATGALLGGSIALASNFEDSMAKVNTIADTSVLSLDDLSKEIIDLSNTTGIGASEIASATYDAISAGQDTADAVNFVSNATSLARAGFTDTGSAIDVLTTIMNAYGLEADKVTNVSDMLIQTQNKGKTTVAELSATMGKIIPTANSMGIGLEQICTGYSIMTAKGIATAETTTYMNSMLNEMGKSSTTVGKILKEKTGKSFQDLIADGKSVGDCLQILKDYADSSGTSFNELWSSAEAGKAGLTLLSGGVDEFNNAVKGMLDSSNATSDALAKLETPSQKAKVAINQIKNAGIDLGEQALSSLAPLIDSICKKIESLTQWFTSLSPSTQQIILVVLALITALGPLLILIGKIATGVGTILNFAPTLLGFLGGLSTPILIIIGAIGLLVAAFVTLWNTNEEFRNKVIEIWNTVSSKFEEFKQNILDKINALGFNFSSFSDLVHGIWQQLCDYLAPVFKATFDEIALILSTAFDILSGLLDIFIGFFTGNWDQMGSGLKQIFEACWNFIKNTFINVTNLLSTLLTKICNFYTTTWQKCWDKVKKFFSDTWDNIVAIGECVPGRMLEIGRHIVEGVWDGICAAKDWFMDNVRGFFSGIVDGAKAALGIHSPSRVFASQVGKWIPAGIGQGIEDNSDSATDPLNSIFDDMTDVNLNSATINRKLNATFRGELDTTQGVDGNRLMSMLDDLSRKLSNLKIVLDSGELVGGLIDPIDSALNTKYNQVVRGW